MRLPDPTFPNPLIPAPAREGAQIWFDRFAVGPGIQKSGAGWIPIFIGMSGVL